MFFHKIMKEVYRNKVAIERGSAIFPVVNQFGFVHLFLKISTPNVFPLRQAITFRHKKKGFLLQE